MMNSYPQPQNTTVLNANKTAMKNNHIALILTLLFAPLAAQIKSMTKGTQQ
jgi:hypothetical protein